MKKEVPTVAPYDWRAAMVVAVAVVMVGFFLIEIAQPNVCSFRMGFQSYNSTVEKFAGGNVTVPPVSAYFEGQVFCRDISPLSIGQHGWFG